MSGPVTLLAAGIDHTTAPLALRERLAIGPHRLGHALEILREHGGCREAAVLSTCLRTDLHLVHPRGDPATLLTEITGVAGEDVARHLRVWRGPEEVARRLMRVAAGLESIVLGESQILHQVKAAYQAATGHGATGPLLSALFERALAAGRRVRRETAIGEGSVSIPALAIRLAEQRIGPLRGRPAVLIGTGEMARLAATHLAARGARLTVVSRRLIERARVLAAEVGASAQPFESDLGFCREADLVVTATSASHTLAGRETLARLLAERREPLILIDLAVPRDIDPDAASVPGLTLIDIGHLERLGESHMERRAEAAQQASEIVEAEVRGFVLWCQSLEVAPTIQALRTHLETLCRREIDRLAGDDRQAREAMERLGHALVGKIAHRPIALLRHEGQRGDGQKVVALIREIFDLPRPPTG